MLAGEENVAGRGRSTSVDAMHRRYARPAAFHAEPALTVISSSLYSLSELVCESLRSAALAGVSHLPLISPDYGGSEACVR